MRRRGRPALAGCLLLMALLAAQMGSATGAMATYAYGPFCQSVLIGSGNTCIAGTPRNIQQVNGQSISETTGGPGSAMVCVGGKTYASDAAPWLPSYVCGGAGQYTQTPYYSNGVGCCTYPALHNHSTFTSRFTGSVSYIE